MSDPYAHCMNEVGRNVPVISISSMRDKAWLTSVKVLPHKPPEIVRVRIPILDISDTSGQSIGTIFIPAVCNGRDRHALDFLVRRYANERRAAIRLPWIADVSRPWR